MIKLFPQHKAYFLKVYFSELFSVHLLVILYAENKTFSNSYFKYSAIQNGSSLPMLLKYVTFTYFEEKMFNYPQKYIFIVSYTSLKASILIHVLI